MDSAFFLSGVFGFILGILLLFVSIVWLIFPFIVMNRLRGIREEIEQGNQNTLGLIQEIAKGNRLLDKIAASATPKITPPRPKGAAPRLTIAKGGEDKGQMDISTVKAMLNNGELTLQDHYFDPESNDWLTLDCHPDFC